MDAEKFILMHSDLNYSMIHVYDPVKAHEYYLRRRQLKGKIPIISSPTSSSTGTKARRPVSSKVQFKSSPKKPFLRSVNVARRSMETKARIEALRTKLEKLKALLNQLVEESNEKSKAVKRNS